MAAKHLLGEEPKLLSPRQSEIAKQIAAYAWLQAVGSNISAIGRTKILSERIRIQEEGQRQIVLGNALQALGNLAETELLLEQNGSEINKLNALGTFLKFVGSSIVVLVGNEILK